MGSAASSSSTDMFPEDIRNTYKESSDMKEEIAKRDAAFINQQANQAWKNHKQIIAGLTERTKSQLQRVAVIYETMREHTDKTASIEIRDMLGGNYGEFMSLLVLKYEVINSNLLDTAFKCIGCDENLVADVLCACTYHEMNETHIYFDGNRDKTLQDTIKANTLENSSFQRFIMSILTTKRDDEDETDDSLAQSQMEEVHATGLGQDDSSSRREEDIFRLLSKTSRAQCELISRHYETAHGMTLGQALGKWFAGSTSRALLLWVSPRMASIASLFYLSLHSKVVDFDLTCHLTTRYQKSHLQEAIKAYKVLYEEDLVGQLSKKLTGNFKKSVIAWLNNPSYDEGNESKIEDMVDKCDGDMTKLLGDPVKLARLRELVDAEHAACQKHLDGVLAKEKAEAEKKKPKQKPVSAPVPEPTPAPALEALSRAASKLSDASKEDGDGVKETEKNAEAIESALNALQVDADEEGAPEPEDTAAAQTEKMFNSPSKRKELGYEDKFKLICEYMLERFKQDDLDDSGTLDSGEFWITLKKLKLGYTDEELGAIEKMVDFDDDGVITYVEVVNELADNLIEIIEASGRTVEDKVAELWEENRMELETLWSEYNAWQLDQEGLGETSLSPDLVQYLRDSFDAFDVDKNGTLNNEEFWQILTTVLGLTEGDRAMMQNEWDDDNDGNISWEEALDEFNKIFKSKINDKRDHWIGLVDKSSGNLFWFNLRDETSFWMSEEDQANYRAFMAGENKGEDKLEPESVPSALSSRAKSFKDGNMKALREFKSVKKGLADN